MMSLDILFVCDAHADTGLGHGSRCAHLAKIISKRNQVVKFAFQGTFSDGAKDFISKMAPGVPFLLPEENVAAGTAFVDRMANTQDTEAWSEDIVARLIKTCGRVVYMASGVTAPPLPEGVICIGYQPSNVVSLPPYLFWGLEFAPTYKEVDKGSASGISREPSRAMVAFGGARNDKHLNTVFEALSLIETITNIDLLGSPVNAPVADNFQLGIHQKLHRHKNGEQLPVLLKRSGLVITSFGNLGYEALAAGAPLCLVGQKRFQVDLAERLEKRGLVVSAGLAGKISKETIGSAIHRTIEKAEELSVVAQKLIDGRGLNRIASIIAPVGVAV